MCVHIKYVDSVLVTLDETFSPFSIFFPALHFKFVVSAFHIFLVTVLLVCIVHQKDVEIVRKSEEDALLMIFPCKPKNYFGNGKFVC